LHFHSIGDTRTVVPFSIFTIGVVVFGKVGSFIVVGLSAPFSSSSSVLVVVLVVDSTHRLVVSSHRIIVVSSVTMSDSEAEGRSISRNTFAVAIGVEELLVLVVVLVGVLEDDMVLCCVVCVCF